MRLIYLVFLTNICLATQWAPFKAASLNFALPNPYAAKETISSWYENRFFKRFAQDEQELIQYIEENHLSSTPVYCTKITRGSITTTMCNPWVLAVFIKDGLFYVIPKRYKFFQTQNHMEILKMNLDMEEYDTYFHIIIPYVSKFTSRQLSADLKLALSFYYLYDYQLHDSCFDYECQHQQRIKRKLTLNYQELIDDHNQITREFLSYSWIHRTLFNGCQYGTAPSPCIAAREITYDVMRATPTVWNNRVSFEKSIPNAWEGSLIWDQLEDDWVTGRKEFNDVYVEENATSGEIEHLPLPPLP